ncbi:MAG: gamma-glutamyltransferase [Myxococcota bacterium]
MSEITRSLDAAGDEDPPARERRGMVVTSQPVAVDAAVEVLRSGGNAVDAAVCAAAVLGVVEPMSTGLGGDCFALVWKADEQKLYGYNGSGRAPAAASLEALHARGEGGMPQDGPLTITVPGALEAWHALLERLGTRALAEVLEPAVRTARDGFEVTPVVARDWAQMAPRLAADPSSADLFLTEGRAPRAGERVRMPDTARILERLARDGIEPFYGGEIAARIADAVRARGGWLSAGDLGEHAGEWVEPMEVTYRGHPVWQMPPNDQGIVVLETLRLLEELPVGDMPDEERAHVMIEAIKLAFADAFAHVTDPAAMRIDPAALLADAYIERRVRAIGERAAPRLEAGPMPSDTVHVAVVDAEGNACALTCSLYMHFGSGVVASGTGVCLQNRGALFSSDPSHPNALAPGKRPYHTIIPSMVFRAGQPWLVFGVVGGYQQPQAQAQIVVQAIDLGMELPAAVAAPRWRWVWDAMIQLEEGFDPEVGRALEARGHQRVDLPLPGGFGGAQAIQIDPDTGALTGASDPRKDGKAAST